MTYSICTTDGRVHGIAIATKAPTVGSLAPFLSKNGAVCTQSLVSVPLGVKTSNLMNQDVSIDDGVNTLLEKDDNPEVRQIHGVDKWGNSIVFSGEDCVEWFGGVTGDNYTVSGNMLEGEHVVEAIADTFESLESNRPPGKRLLKALQAGEDAGGDKRAGKAQSAALKIYHPTEPRLHHDLRVDDQEDPVSELQRVYDVTRDDDKSFREEFPQAILQRYP